VHLAVGGRDGVQEVIAEPGRAAGQPVQPSGQANADGLQGGEVEILAR
jgi:hypothetical protein